MPLEPNEESTLMQYLRGELSDTERDAIADRLAQDDEFFLALEEMETEWIDRLARGELSIRETARVRKYLSDTGQLDRLVIAGALKHAASAENNVRTSPAPALGTSNTQAAKRGPSRSMRGFLGAIAAAVALVVVGALLYFGNILGNQSAEIVSSRPPTLQAPHEVIVFIAAGVARGTSALDEHLIPQETTSVRFRLEIPEGRNFPVYRAALLGSDNQASWQHIGAVTPGNPRLLEFVVPIETVGYRHRELVLFGRNNEGKETLLSYYPFSLKPQQRSDR